MGGSLYYERLGHVGQRVPSCDPLRVFAIFSRLYRAIADGHVLACADVSEGGLASVATEMCFGNELGFEVVFSQSSLEDFEVLFSESPGRFVVEVAVDRVEEFKHLFEGFSLEWIGKIESSGAIQFKLEDRILIEGNVRRFKRIWQEPMEKVFA